MIWSMQRLGKWIERGEASLGTVQVPRQVTLLNAEVEEVPNLGRWHFTQELKVDSSMI